MQQGSEEWVRARVGKVTASRVHDIVATTKSGGYTAGRKNYLAELLKERLTGLPVQSFQSAAMLYGIETEPEARFAYSLERNVEVIETGFVLHPGIAEAGCSPDGLIGDDGLIEIKCPDTAQHIDMLLTGKIEPKYIDQMQFQLACTQRSWCDFVSYDSRLPSEMQLFIARVPASSKIIGRLELEVTQFLIDLNATVDLLKQRFPRRLAVAT